MDWMSIANGTVRSTAFFTRLRACPAPDGVGTAVAQNSGLLPGRRRGQVSGSAEVGALERGPAASAGGRWRQIVEGGAGGQPGGPRRSLHQQRLAVVGGVPDSVHRTAGE